MEPFRNSKTGEDFFICPRCSQLRLANDPDQAACIGCGVCTICVPTSGIEEFDEYCDECRPMDIPREPEECQHVFDMPDDLREDGRRLRYPIWVLCEDCGETVRVDRGLS